MESGEKNQKGLKENPNKNNSNSTPKNQDNQDQKNKKEVNKINVKKNTDGFIKERNVLIVYLLLIVTFGFYGIYWFIKTKDDFNKLGANVPTGWLLIIPFVNFYWLYKYCEAFSINVNEDDNKWMWFAVTIIIGFVMPAIVQLKLNEISRDKTKQIGKKNKSSVKGTLNQNNLAQSNIQDGSLKLEYLPVGQKVNIIREFLKAIPKEFRPTEKVGYIFVGLFVLVIAVGLANAILPILDFSFDLSGDAKPFEVDIDVGLPFMFFGTDEFGDINISFTNFMLDFIIWMILSYFIDVCLNFLLSIKLKPSKEELKRKPKEISIEKRSLSEKTSDKIIGKIIGKIKSKQDKKIESKRKNLTNQINKENQEENKKPEIEKMQAGKPDKNQTNKSVNTSQSQPTNNTNQIKK